MTPAERKAKERRAKRAAGLVPVEIWVPADQRDLVRSAFAALEKLPLDAKMRADMIREIEGAKSTH